MASDTLVWHGGPHTVVALDLEVNDGDKVAVEDPALRDQLLAVAGFTLRDGSNPLAPEPPELLTRKQLEAKAEELGLALYPTEDDAALAVRVSSAGGDPTKSVKKTSSPTTGGSE